MADDQTNVTVDGDDSNVATTTTITSETHSETTPTPRDVVDDRDSDSVSENDENLPKWVRDALTKANREAASYRDRAKKAEADAKAKADALSQFEALADASKSEAEKQADRISALEKSLRDAETARSRAAIQARFGLSDEIAADLLDGDDVERMERRAARFAESAAAAKRVTAPVPAEGRRNPVPESDPMVDFVREVFGPSTNR